MKLLIPPPSEKQRLFLNDAHRYVAFGGARGGGKSWAVRVKAVMLCAAHPGIKVMIVRRTYGELRANHIVPLCALLRCGEEGARRLAVYNDTKKELAFPNGSRILFRYCDTDRDADRFQGTEVDVLFVDEATQQPEETVKKLTACVRGVNSFPKRVYYTCNPGGVGHGWVKRLFLERRFRPGERPEDYVFIPSRVTDNLALMRADPEYLRRLEALPEKLREAWLNGNWDVFEGQFFEEFRTSPDLAAARAAARQGLWHKLGEIAALLVAALCDIAVQVILHSTAAPLLGETPSRHYLTLIVAIWYTFTELGSIIENAGKLGAPIPEGLRRGIALLRDKTESGSPDKG